MSISVDRIKSRNEIPLLLDALKCKIGVELGVAIGSYSQILLAKSQLQLLHSVDMWAGDRGHDLDEYIKALHGLNKFGSRSIVIRAKFNEAARLFKDDVLDFIYVDGYAHTAQDNGRTLDEWYPKLKIGGLFAGHDFTWKKKAYERNTQIVCDFAQKQSLKLYVTNKDDLPSWMVIKK